MKRCGFARICITVCLAFGMALLPVSSFQVRADEIIATVSGTIASGTTAEILKLSTKEGTMEIKMDSGTDASASKVLLPGKKINVSVSHGSDGFLHAVKITGDAQSNEVSLDASSITTVTGTIGDKSSDSLLYFKTDQGEMQIKLDVTTSLGGCSVLVSGKTYYISCTRGSDAYMHAISITDAAPGTAGAAGTITTGQNAGTAAPSVNNIASMSVTGTVSERTKENLLYLSTKDGEMQFAIDSNADTSKGMVLTPGNKLTVSFYHGSDAYLHAVGITGIKDNSSSVEIDMSGIATVTGTVDEKSSEKLLYLNTSGGRMELKLDAVNSLNNCKVLVKDKKLTVTCARGSDAYMHAIDITAN